MKKRRVIKFSNEIPEMVFSEQLTTEEVQQRNVQSKGKITGLDLLEIGMQQKYVMNNFLQQKTGMSFSDPFRPTAGLVRRLVAYKEQGILFDIIPYIVGDRDKEYETPWGKKHGLAMNLLIGGAGRDGLGKEWVRGFKEIMYRFEYAGKVIFIDGSGIDTMQKVTQGCDFWLSIPRSTREACGTSDQRAAESGRLNIATYTGGPAEYIIDGVNGWIMNIFPNSPSCPYSFKTVVSGMQTPEGNHLGDEVVSFFQKNAQRLLAEKLSIASTLYYEFWESGNMQIIDMMQHAYEDSHSKMHIIRMVMQYNEMFSLVRNSAAQNQARIPYYDIQNLATNFANINGRVETSTTSFALTADFEVLQNHFKEGSFVADVTNEAFLSSIKSPLAQETEASGGLGFLAGETFGGFGQTGTRAVGLMQAYELHHNKATDQYTSIDWDNEKGVEALLIERDGKKVPFTYSVNFNSTSYEVAVYVVFQDGTPVFLLRQPEINNTLYPEDGSQSVRQKAFLCRAMVALFKQFGVAPDIIRLNEPQLFFAAPAIDNDISYHVNNTDKESIFKETSIVLTTHTPEAAALPVFYDLDWLRGQVGPGLVPGWATPYGHLNLARALASHAKVKIINAVAQEHAEVTKMVILPNSFEKIVAITNGSDPKLWKCDTLQELEKERSI